MTDYERLATLRIYVFSLSRPHHLVVAIYKRADLALARNFALCNYEKQKKKTRYCLLFVHLRAWTRICLRWRFDKRLKRARDESTQNHH